MPWVGALIGAGASIIGGAISSGSDRSAGRESADAQIKSAELQKQAADEALAFQRELFGYGQEQDLLSRAWAERNAAQNLFGYNDAYQAFQDQFQFSRAQTDYGNQIRNNILGQLNDFSMSGRSQLPDLYKMTGQPMGNIPVGLQAPFKSWDVQTPNLYPNEQRKSVMPSYETFRQEFESYLDNLIKNNDRNRFRESEDKNNSEDQLGQLINEGVYTGGRTGGGTQRGSGEFEKLQNLIRQHRGETLTGSRNPSPIPIIRTAMVNGTISTEEALFLLSLASEASAGWS